MPSLHQINANRENAQASTGPRTEAGKAASSRNHLTAGLYTRADYVRPEERELYKEFCETMLAELGPETLLEQSLAAEITGATWRLRRCSAAEAELADYALTDPLLSDDESTEKKLRSIERARASAHSLLHRSINQLRKLQTSREKRFELLNAENDPEQQPQPQPDLNDKAARKQAERAFEAALFAAIEPPTFIKEAIKESLENVRLRNVAEGLEPDYAPDDTPDCTLGSNCELTGLELTEEEAAAIRESEELGNLTFEDLAALEEIDETEDEAA
jgi:hypothetical protein